MNYNFNMNRFARLFLKHTAEHYKSYLMSLAVLIGVLVLGGCFLVYMVEARLDKNVQSALYMIMLFLAGTIFTSTVLTDLGDRKKAVAWLTLPASHFEKYLVAWVYSLLIFLVVYTASFYLSAVFVVNIKQFDGHRYGVLNIFERRIFETCLIYAFLHSVALYGAVFFERLHFIKTAFVFFISLALLVIINKIILGALLGRAVESTPPFSNVRFSGSDQEVRVAEKLQEPYMIWLVTVLAVIFWIAAYWRLKEKQV